MDKDNGVEVNEEEEELYRILYKSLFSFHYITGEAFKILQLLDKTNFGKEVLLPFLERLYNEMPGENADVLLQEFIENLLVTPEFQCLAKEDKKLDPETLLKDDLKIYKKALGWELVDKAFFKRLDSLLKEMSSKLKEDKRERMIRMCVEKIKGVFSE